MSYKPGDVIWVPSSTVVSSDIGQNMYWPAKFVKQTNRQDICMVCLYSSKPQQADQQFLVDTDQILPFDKYEPTNPTDDLLHAYKLGLQQYLKQNKSTINQPTISTSEQFCKFVQTNLIQDLMNIDSSTTKINKNLFTIPKFANDSMPTSSTDLQKYFQRKIPQTLNFLIESSHFKDPALLAFLRQARNKIIQLIISKVQIGQLRLSPV